MLSEFIGDFKKYTYRLLLCKMNYTPITLIPYSDLTYTENFNGYNELTVEIPNYIRTFDFTNEKQTTIINPAWQQIKSNLVILLTQYNGNTVSKQEYFTISDFSLSADSTTKSIACTASHQIYFNHLIFDGYDDTRKLYDFTDTVDNPVKWSTSDYTKGGVLNYLIEYKFNNSDYETDSDHWHVSYYDTALDSLFEADEISDSDIEDLCENVGGYWTISHSEDDMTSYTGNVEATEDVNTLHYWAAVLEKAIEDNELIDLYAVRAEIEEKMNVVMEDISDAVYLMGRGDIDSDSVADLINNPYIGTKILTLAEEAISYMQGIIDEMCTINVVAYEDEDGNGYEILNMSMLLYEDLNVNLLEPLLIFKGYSGKRPYRTLSFDGSNLTDVFEELADAYMCIFDFDNVNREIKIYSRGNAEVGEENHMIISPRNIMTNITRSDNTEKVVTRLYITGKDSATVAGVNPTGQRYVDDFSYFMTTDYMSEELITALNTYTEILESDEVKEKMKMYVQKLESWQNDYDYLYDYYVKYNNANDEYEYIGNLRAKETDEDKIAEYDIELTALETAIDSYENIVGYKGENVTELEEKIEAWQSEYTAYRQGFLYENVVDGDGNAVFTDDLLSELNNFIFESELTVDTISEDSTLFYYAKEYLQYINKVPITISTSLVDILSNYKYQKFWDNLNKTGDLIMVDYEPFNLDKEYFRLISYSHTLSSCDLVFNFSNEYEIKDGYNSLLKKVWKYTYTLSKNVEKYRDSWEEYIETKELYLQEGQEINSSINKIVNSEGKTIIGSGGIVLSAQEGNGLQALGDGLYSASSDLSSIIHICDTVPDDSEVVDGHLYFIKVVTTDSSGGDTTESADDNSDETDTETS